MSKYPNPFGYSRREFESDMPIYLPGHREGVPKWIHGQQYIFEGVRGSGKSSILQSMNWEARWLEKIKLVASEKVLTSIKESNHLGICYGFELEDRSNWAQWAHEVGTRDAQNYFGTYIEYLLLDLFLNALVSIWNKKKIQFFHLESESKVVINILQEAFPNPDRRPRLPEYSFEALRYVIRDRHIALRDLIYSRIPTSEIKLSFPVLSPGSLVRCFAQNFIEHCQDKYTNMMFFPMLDDCDNLENWQIQVVNSAVSRAKAPVSYKITAVRNLYLTRITADGRPLIEHVLKTVILSSDKKGRWVDIKKFEPVIEGVLRTRLEKSYDEKIAESFDSKTLLGQFDIDKLMMTRLSASENPEAAKLLARAKQRARQNGQDISITSTWLAEHNIRTCDDTIELSPEIESQKRRLSRSSYWNKWKTSAALAICQQLDIKFPYCGWDAILHLGCMSIREVLRMLYEIWEISDMSIDKFIQQNSINPQIQSQGIMNAANKLFDSFENNSIPLRNSRSIKTQQTESKMYNLPIICDRLGKLFAIFQSYPYIKLTAECASLKVNKNRLNTETIESIDFGVISGAFLVDKGKTDITLGLNPTLAPKYNISYRNPFYYPQRVTPEEFEAIFKGNDNEAAETSNRILNHRQKRIPKGKQMSFILIGIDQNE